MTWRPCGTVALELLRAFDPQRPVRLLGVRVAGLDEERGRHRKRHRPLRASSN